MKDILQHPAFLHTGFVEKNTVICKEKVGDFWAALTNGYTYQKLVPNSPINKCRKPLSTNEKKCWREGGGAI